MARLDIRRPTLLASTWRAAPDPEWLERREGERKRNGDTFGFVAIDPFHPRFACSGSSFK